MDLGTCILRHARCDEFKKILRFYEENQSDNISSREPAQLFQSIEDKKAFIVLNEKEEIVAAACVFDSSSGDYREAGATVVSPRYQGFHFQRILLWVRFLQEEIFDPDFKILFSTVFETSPGSIHNLEKTGFTRQSPDENVRGWKSFEPKIRRRYYELARSNGRRLASHLLELDRNSTLVRKKDEAFLSSID